MARAGGGGEQPAGAGVVAAQAAGAERSGDDSGPGLSLRAAGRASRRRCAGRQIGCRARGIRHRDPDVGRRARADRFGATCGVRYGCEDDRRHCAADARARRNQRAAPPVDPLWPRPGPRRGQGPGGSSRRRHHRGRGRHRQDARGADGGRATRRRTRRRLSRRRVVGRAGAAHERRARSRRRGARARHPARSRSPAGSRRSLQCSRRSACCSCSTTAST